MLTRTSEYALRAMIHLAHHEKHWPVPGRTIAKAADIPPKYLSKILGDLVRAGVLGSTPGKSGGFRMSKRAEEISLFSVLKPFEQFTNRRCPFGNQQCNDTSPCNAHNEWKKVLEAQQQFLRQTSVHDIADKMSLRVTKLSVKTKYGDRVDP